METGPDEHAQQLGIQPLTSVSGNFDMSDETVFHALYRHWASKMGEAVA